MTLPFIDMGKAGREPYPTRGEQGEAPWRLAECESPETVKCKCPTREATRLRPGGGPWVWGCRGHQAEIMGGDEGTERLPRGTRKTTQHLRRSQKRKGRRREMLEAAVREAGGRLQYQKVKGKMAAKRS